MATLFIEPSSDVTVDPCVPSQQSATIEPVSTFINKLWAYVVALLLLSVFSGTASAQVLRIDVTLSPRSASEWRVDYDSSMPVEALMFVRGNGNYRVSTWQFDSDDFVIERVGRTDRIKRRDGRRFRSVSATILPYTRKPDAEYAPFVEFSDGSFAVFTGQFAVGVPTVDDPAAFALGLSSRNAIGPVDPQITVAPGVFERMIVNAAISNEQHNLSLDGGEYVYFGAAAAVETETFTAVTDPAAPEWLRAWLAEALTRTYEYYSYRLGNLRGDKPFILASFEPLDEPYINFTGGVVGSQLVVDMALGRSVPDLPESREAMVGFFAHESAHFWHRGGGIAAGGEGSWVHEGGADAKAWLALLALDMLSADAVRKNFEDAINRCVAQLAEGSLNESERRGDFSANYDCGATISLATHAIMRAQGRDLFDFWRVLLNGGPGQDDFRVDNYFFEAGRAEPGFGGRLIYFADTHHADSGAAVLALLTDSQVSAMRLASGKIVLEALP